MIPTTIKDGTKSTYDAKHMNKTVRLLITAPIYFVLIVVGWVLLVGSYWLAWIKEGFNDWDEITYDET